MDRATAKRGLREIEGERERIARLAGIREVVFGGQDGLISTTTLVAGIAATTTQNAVVLVAGTIAAIAGALSMTVGSYLASRAQRQLYESELANEQREVAEKPGEEMAELLAALIGRGMPRHDAIEVMRRIAAHPGLMLEMLGAFELGLVPGSLGSPHSRCPRDRHSVCCGLGCSAFAVSRAGGKTRAHGHHAPRSGSTLCARGNEGLAFRATNGCEWAGSVAAGWRQRVRSAMGSVFSCLLFSELVSKAYRAPDSLVPGELDRRSPSSRKTCRPLRSLPRPR